MQVTFAPLSPGSYEGVVMVRAMLVVSSEHDRDALTASIILKALAEKPKLEVCSSIYHRAHHKYVGCAIF